MLIESLEMKYFFRTYYSGVLDFTINKDHNVILVKGNNGTGKTTMINAFTWAFYDMIEKPLKVEEMLNKKRLSELEIGEKDKVFVKVIISENGNKFIIKRELEFQKIDKYSAIPTGKSQVTITNFTNPKELIDPNFMEGIIPSKLRGFFFFDGERIENLAKIDGKKEIREAILDILGLNLLDRVDKNLRDLNKEFADLIEKNTNDDKLKDLSNKLKEAENEKETVENQYKSYDNKSKELGNTISELKSFFEKHNKEKINTLQKDRETAESNIKTYNDKLKENEINVIKHISKNFRIFLLKNKIDKINNFLEEKRKKRELPSDIKQQFVKDLLSSGVCICGEKIVEGDEHYQKLTQLLKIAGHDELDSAYATMNAFLKSDDTTNIINSFYDDIDEYKLNKINLNEKIEECKNVITKINKELLNDDEILVAEKQKLLQDAEDKKRNIDVETEIARRKIIELDETIKDLTVQMEKISDKNGQKSIYENAFNYNNILLEFNKKVKDTFIKETREDMDAKTKDVFKKLNRKENRTTKLDENFELSTINIDNGLPVILSQGECQVTSLSFIGALVSYSRDKVKSNLKSDFSGGDFPIVMDSPFGQLDQIHKQNVSKNIAGLSSQVIIIVSDEQWNSTVKDGLLPFVNRTYIMEDGDYKEQSSEYTVFRAED